jgi:hypothetical protein
VLSIGIGPDSLMQKELETGSARRNSKFIGPAEHAQVDSEASAQTFINYVQFVFIQSALKYTYPPHWEYHLQSN